MLSWIGSATLVFNTLRQMFRVPRVHTVNQRRTHLRSRMRASRVTPAPTPDYLIAPPTVPSYRVVD